MNILLVENPTHQVTVPPAIWLRLAARCRPPSAPGGTPADAIADALAGLAAEARSRREATGRDRP